MMIYSGMAVCWFLLCWAMSEKTRGGLWGSVLVGLTWPVWAAAAAAAWVISAALCVVACLGGWDPGGPDHGSNA